MTPHDLQILLNPTYAAGEGMEAEQRLQARNALVRQAKDEGLTLRTQILYTQDGTSAGQRIGLFDSVGCMRECFYTPEGLGDIQHALRTLYDVEGKAPIGW